MRQMQSALDKVQAWADKWGFRLSVLKTKYVVFGRKRKLDCQGLTVYGEAEPLGRVKVFKFLGVWLDEKLTNRTHVEKMVGKCEKIINIMRCLSG